MAVARRPPHQDIDTDEGDARARRAFRAAMLGMVFFPPLLNLFSAFILAEAVKVPLSSTGAKHVRYAWCINGTVFALTAFIVAVSYFTRTRIF